MTAQHAPPALHTPPLWRRVFSLPQTRLGWLSVVLVVVLVVLPTALASFGVVNDVFNDVPFRVTSQVVFLLVVAGLLASAIVGLIALLKSQERSVLVWLAMVPVVLAPAVPIIFLVQWLNWMLRHQLPMVPFVLFLVAMMAVVGASHLLQRGTERYGLGGTISSAASLVGLALIVVGALSQNKLVGINLMVVGLWAATIGLAGLAVVTLRAGVLPWWGGVALIAANPFLVIIFLFSTYPPGDFTTGSFLTLWLVPVPMLVVGFAVFLAARRRTERPARVR